MHVAKKSGADLSRSEASRLEEAVALTAAIGLHVVDAVIAPLARATPATLIGAGKANEIKTLCHALEPEVVIVNAQLSPVQQRNLERLWGAKVLDRTALILEIFGERARTREGRLQVELAHLTYQRSRLVKSWTHLERQRGGFGFLGGPGETQIETDRRLIGERIAKIKRELEEVKRTRGLHRRARKKVPYPVVALVGYTNAGKSTLFNRLTSAEVLAKDMLFATLDPTMRGLKLPSGRSIILSDTVGFIADLPTQLVAAFRATLEEVLEADIILHVRDAAHDESDAQKADVLTVLHELGVVEDERKLVEVLNKIDLLEPDVRNALLTRNRMASRMLTGEQVAVSAVTGAGLDALTGLIDRLLGSQEQTMRLTLALDDGAGMAWAYENGRVLERRQTDKGLYLVVAGDDEVVERFSRRFPGRLTIIDQTQRRRAISS
ncbi:MAG TPA: GTPase HflX [Micropepsaceae bacterium]|nr:GTPase HflX [Micropepsaceae bacterium]